MKKEIATLRTWVEVDRKNIASNYRTFRSLIHKKTKLMAIVKSNAYGHGLTDFAKEVVSLGADFLGVDSVVEALALRKEGLKVPILVLGYTMPSRVKEAVEHNISLTVSSLDALKGLVRQKYSVPLSVHVKVDTGMHRQGFQSNELDRVISALRAATSRVIVDGLYTHFASAKNPSFPQYTKKQLAEFSLWIDRFNKAGIHPIVHAAASAGTILFPESHFDMVRVGIGLYGLWPAQEVEAFRRDSLHLKPAMTWRTIVSEVKKVQKGEKVGYDSTETLARDSVLAVCPIGYWHGYPRALSSIGRVLVKGSEARVVGRVSMDMIVIDVTHIPRVALHDEVTLVAGVGEGPASAKHVAMLADRSPYEIITCINPLIKRLYR